MKLKRYLHSHSIIRIYAFSALVTIGTFLVVALSMGPTAFVTVVILCALEITFSFDNAVVNAKILNKMPEFWRKMFMTIGIFIAVFGMRLVLPIVLVAITAQLDISRVADLALSHPNEYAAYLHNAHPLIASFGGLFLLMIFLEFMFDDKRDIHWIKVIEEPLIKVGQLRQFKVILGLIILLLVTETFGAAYKFEVLLAGIMGMLTYLIIRALASLFERERKDVQAKLSHSELIRAGFFNFLYLEVLDASFSFDGVIGAFALTNVVLLIAAGLGVGAIWVRSMTVHMVRRHTLRKYRYLDHGAHYAIGVLSTILLIGIAYEIPEAVTGLVGIGIIVLAFASSWRHNQKLKQLTSEQKIVTS
jgi:hypothetical protein